MKVRICTLLFSKAHYADLDAAVAWATEAGCSTDREKAGEDASGRAWRLPCEDEPDHVYPVELAHGVVARLAVEREAPTPEPEAPPEPDASDEPTPPEDEGKAAEPAPVVPPTPDLATRAAPDETRKAVVVFRALGPTEAAPDGFTRTQDGTTIFVASEPVPDRYDDIVDPSWKLDNYRRNPVVLYGHSWGEPPIGRSVQVGVVNGRLLAEVEWDTEDEGSARIASKVARGFLNTISVGFRPGRCIDRSDLPDTDARKGPRGCVLFDNELLELSVVAVPALPSAEAIRSPAALLDAVRDQARRDPAFFRSLEAVILAAPSPRPASAGDTPATAGDGWWPSWR